MLRACNRVLRPDGKIAFFVIAMAASLTHAERRALVEQDIGPPHLDAGPGYATLMDQAGFRSVEIADVTGEYMATVAAWIRERERESEALAQLVGADKLHETLASNRRTLHAIQQGAILRYLISAHASYSGLHIG